MSAELQHLAVAMNFDQSKHRGLICYGDRWEYGNGRWWRKAGLHAAKKWDSQI